MTDERGGGAGAKRAEEDNRRAVPVAEARSHRRAPTLELRKDMFVRWGWVAAGRVAGGLGGG